MTPEARHRFRQLHSGPVLGTLQVWLTAQFAEKKVEPITFSAGAANAKILKRISSASARSATEPCMRD